jgi:pimeloyl-ACP methyl ester carboxylesterase
MANSVSHNLAQVRRTGLRLTARYMRRLPLAVMADCRRFTFRSLTSTLEHCLLHYRIDELLPTVPRVPILLIHGDSDQVAPVERTLAFPGLHPYPALQVIKGAGHHPFHTHTATCLELIRAHVEDGSPALNGDGTVVFVASGSKSPPPLRSRDGRSDPRAPRSRRWRIRVPSRR